MSSEDTRFSSFRKISSDFFDPTSPMYKHLNGNASERLKEAGGKEFRINLEQVRIIEAVQTSKLATFLFKLMGRLSLSSSWEKLMLPERKPWENRDLDVLYAFKLVTIFSVPFWYIVALDN